MYNMLTARMQPFFNSHLDFYWVQYVSFLQLHIFNVTIFFKKFLLKNEFKKKIILDFLLQVEIFQKNSYMWHISKQAELCTQYGPSLVMETYSAWV